MKPREYQTEAIQSVYTYFEEGNKGNPLIALPTGTGKSVVVAGLCGGIVERWPSQRIMMLTHVKELIEQNHKKQVTMYPDVSVGVYSAGLKSKDTTQNIIFGGIQSVAKKATIFGHIDLIIIDECHLVSPSSEASYGRFIEDLKLYNPHLKVIGLTATPYRLKLGLMTNGQIFDDICYDKTSGEDFLWFIQQGYLSNLVPKPTKTQFNLEGVAKRGGEFVTGDLQDACDKEAITLAAVEETIEVGVSNRRMKWMFFTTGVEHGQRVTDMLNERGIEARFVHSKMSGDREAAIQWFCNPTDKPIALVNVDTLTTGFDCPDLDLLVILRPTMSPGLWVQILGRGTRPAYAVGFDLSTTEGRLAAIAAGPKPNCMVLDFAGNTARLGPINRVEIPLPPGEKNPFAKAPSKICPSCNTYVWAAAQFCEHCNHEFPPPQHKLKSEASTSSLVAGQTTELEVSEYEVDRVTYHKHEAKRRGTVTLKAKYYCGLEVFDEYLSFESTGFPRQKAEQWWHERSRMNWTAVPNTIEEALKYAEADHLKQPKMISVRIDTKYPQILRSYEYV